MKKTLFFLFFTVAIHLNAQNNRQLNGGKSNIGIDKTLEQQFNKIKEQFCQEHRGFIEKSDNSMKDGSTNGYALCLISSVDTLNLKEIIYPGFVLEKDEMPLNCYEVFFVHAEINADLFDINFGFPFGNEFVKHSIVNDSVRIQFLEKFKDDNILKLNSSDPFTNELDVPVMNATLKLDKDNYQKGDLAFGYGEFETIPYFIKDMYLEPALHIKRTYKYFFKTIVR